MKILQASFRPQSVLFKPKLREHRHKNVIVIMARFIQLLASQKQPGYRCSVKTKINQTAFKCSQIYTTLPLCATRVWWKWLKGVVRAQPKIRRTRSKYMQHLFQQKGKSSQAPCYNRSLPPPTYFSYYFSKKYFLLYSRIDPTWRGILVFYKNE